MPSIRGITISVGQWYADTSAICLVRNLRHWAEALVVTAPGDPVVEVARAVPGVRVLESDSGTKYGAMFNKGLLMEEGLDALGRHGQIMIVDADILLPDVLPLDRFQPDALNGAKRRILADPAQWRPDLDWRMCPLHPDGGPIGFCQWFDADSPCVKGKRPFYDVTFAHAGGGDAFFMEHWPKKVTLPFEVLHLGPPDHHWFGTDPAAVEKMAAFVHRNGWTRAAKKHDPAAVQRVGQFAERVGEQVKTEKGLGWQVPGFPVSHFELPFVRRAQANRRRK